MRTLLAVLLLAGCTRRTLRLRGPRAPRRAGPGEDAAGRAARRRHRRPGELDRARARVHRGAPHLGARGELPGSLITVAAARNPTGMHPGLAHVQRSEIPRDAIDVPQTVRQTLETMRDRLREQFPAAGMTVEQFSFAERDDGIEGCVERR